MAKIAIGAETSSILDARPLDAGDGWKVSDIVCSAGPRDRPFEEQHSGFSIAIVVSGTFQYRSATGSELMTPGSLLLGNAGECFRCSHDHATGDRCISFSYSADFFDGIANGNRFRSPRIPSLRTLSPLIADACSTLAGLDRSSFEELAVRVAAGALQMDHRIDPRGNAVESTALARVTQIVRMIDEHPEHAHTLASLAQFARLSPYHFLRVFESLTGATPHQYLVRVRLRRAALRLKTEPSKILDIALDSGFGDVSNFNHAFRAEFGQSPRAYRLSA